ncbi:MAG: metallophosphoesterase family protein [Eggerthellaceae bacterium]
MTFIHAADLHLGAPFLGLRHVSERWADRLIRAVPEAFDRLIQSALDHNVDFVLISGDLFDAAHPSYGEFMRFIDGVNRLGDAGIPVYFCTGNHDPYTAWRKSYASLPENAFMFSASRPSYFCYERAGEPLVALMGRGFYSQSWAADEKVEEGLTPAEAHRALGVDTPFTVGVIHTGLDRDPSKAPVSPAALLRTKTDYWALGHLHTPEIVDSTADPHIVYAGCIQGRAMNETGMHGIALVTLTTGQPNQLTFIPTASVVWEQPQVDVSSCESISDMVERVQSTLRQLNAQNHCNEMIERVTLVGATPIHELLQQPNMLDEVRQRINDEVVEFYCDAVIDKTSLPVNRAALRNEGLFPAVFMEAAERQMQEPDRELAFLQREFAQRGFSLPRSLEQELQELGADAESLVLDMLNGGRA